MDVLRTVNNYVKVVNDLHDKLLNSNTDELRGFKEKALESMREYALFHFIDEEKYMTEIGYPDLQKHKSIHDEFITKLRDYETRFKEGKILFNSDILKTLIAWLHNHLLTEDKKYTVFASQKKN